MGKAIKRNKEAGNNSYCRGERHFWDAEKMVTGTKMKERTNPFCPPPAFHFITSAAPLAVRQLTKEEPQNHRDLELKYELYLLYFVYFF